MPFLHKHEADGFPASEFMNKIDTLHPFADVKFRQGFTKNDSMFSSVLPIPFLVPFEFLIHIYMSIKNSGNSCFICCGDLFY